MPVAETRAEMDRRLTRSTEGAGQAPVRTRRVLAIAYDFPPSMEMGAQACAQLARHLPRYGWEPVVLTVQEGNIEAIDARPGPGGPCAVERTGVLPHPLSLYRGLRSRIAAGTEHAGGVTTSTGEEAGALRRWVLSLLHVPDQYTGWIPPAVIAGRRLVRSRGIDHLFSTGPRWTNHLVALALQRLTGLPWTAHFRDPWTQATPWKPVSALSIRIEARLERMVIERARTVVCVTAAHTGLLRHAYPELPAGKFVTVPNGYDGSEWDALAREGRIGAETRGDRFVVTYAGTFYQRRSPGPLFHALRTLIDDGEIAPDRIRVNLLGDCERLADRPVGEIAREYGIGECVRVAGRVPREQTLREMTESDLLLLLAEGLTVQIPGKTYEYLRAARPILALASRGAVADLLQRTGGARVLDPADQAGVTAAVREVYRGWRDGRPATGADPVVVAGFDRRVLAGRFADIFAGGTAEDGHD